MARYATTRARSLWAIAAGVAPAILLAHLRTYGALEALGLEGWVNLFGSHLLTLALDFGVAFALALFVWFVLDRNGRREPWLAVIVGAACFFAVSMLSVVLVMSQYGYWSIPLRLGFRDAAIGAVLAALMWLIAYRRSKVTASTFE